MKALSKIWQQPRSLGYKTSKFGSSYEIQSELWQWIKHCSKTSEGKIVTFEFVSSLVSELVKSIEAQLGESFSQRHFLFAQEKLLAMLEVSEFLDFMPALLYPHLIETSELKL